MPAATHGQSPDGHGSRTTVLRWMGGLAIGSLLVTGVSAVVLRETPRATVVTEQVAEPSSQIASPRSRGGAPRPTTDTAEAECQGQPPGPGWGCHEGRWQLGAPSTSASADSAMSGGGGRADRASGCLSDRPAPSFVCQDGLWTIASGGSTGSAAMSGTGEFDSDRCPPPDPGEGWACRDGGWVPTPSSIRVPAMAPVPAAFMPDVAPPMPVPVVTSAPATP